jgi:ribosome biogenesis GTPase
VVAGDDRVQNEGVVEQVQPRTGTLARVVGRRRHTLVANVDQVVIVASAGVPSFKPHLVDRYIVAAHAGGIEPLVCLNKVDLDEGGAARKGLKIYADLGYRTVATSAERGLGIDQLRDVLRAKCSTFAGQSGVGKSSLANAVDPSLNLRTGEVNTDLGKGRHITTTALLIKLNCGGYVVDTPGVRTFDLSAVPLHEIEMHLREFAPHIPHCKFPSCTHTHEIGCAVKAAIDAGRITPQRYESYCRMYEERSGAN